MGESTHDFSTLKGRRYMSLTTFRKNGQAVSTPVWFADVGGKLYVTTSRVSGKVKRLRNNPAITVAPCTASGKVLGPTTAGTARLLPDSEASAAEQALAAKYGWQKRLFSKIILWRKKQDDTVYLEITPEQPHEPTGGPDQPA